MNVRAYLLVVGALFLGAACGTARSDTAAAAAAENGGGPGLDRSAAQLDVVTFQYDNLRSGLASHETMLAPANVDATSFGKKASFPVDGYVYAQPLYVSSLQVQGATREVLFVATQHDSVYAFDASGAVTEPVWHVSLLRDGELPVPAADTKTTDIVPEIGITGTPVIDRAAEILYVVSKAKKADGSYVQRLHALRLADGTEAPGAPVDIAAQVLASSLDAVDGKLAFEALRHNQRSALALVNGQVLIAWASHGDVEPYHGWLMAYDTANLTKAPVAFVTTPDGAAGGIWMGASGPTSDEEGNIYVASGNGTFESDDEDTDFAHTNFALSAMKLRLDAGKLTLVDWFSPHGTAALNAGDLDFGTTAVLPLPDRAGVAGHRLVAAGKTGIVYVLDRDDMGHYDSETDHVLQSFSVSSKFLISNPVVLGDTLYVCPHKVALMAFEMDPATGLFGEDPTSISPECDGCFSRGSTPSISADGTKNAIIWLLDNSMFASSKPAILHAYDATDLSKELYASPADPLLANAAGPAVKFTVPVVANGHVFVGGQSVVTMYGLLSP